LLSRGQAVDARSEHGVDGVGHVDGAALEHASRQFFDEEGVAFSLPENHLRNRL
jgi:hypothetical protein